MRFRRFAWGVLGVSLFVILWGAFVRASGSGAGCGRHWPLCNGQVLPVQPGPATLIEFAHRASSGLALLLVVILFAWSRRDFAPGHRARRWAGWSLLFVCSEALVGAGLVLLELVGTDDSLARAGYLAAHLLNTFLLLGCLALTAYHAAPSPDAPAPEGAPRWPFRLGLLLLLLVGMSGAVTALGDTLFPSRTLAEGLQADASATSHLLLRLRVLHPVIAALTGGYLLALVWWSSARRPGGGWGRAVAGLVLLQLALGSANLILLAPTALQLGHLLTADLLWIAVVVYGATVRAERRAAPRAVSPMTAARASAAPDPAGVPER